VYSRRQINTERTEALREERREGDKETRSGQEVQTSVLIQLLNQNESSTVGASTWNRSGSGELRRRSPPPPPDGRTDSRRRHGNLPQVRVARNVADRHE